MSEMVKKHPKFLIWRMPNNMKKHLIILLLSLISAFIVCNFTEDISYKILGNVYFKSVVRIKVGYDSLGIPIVDYGFGKIRNPVTVSQHAMEFFECEKRREFINCANWLVDNSKSFGEYSILEYAFPWPIFNLTSPWRSGMAQAQAIQVLTRAYDFTKDIKYLNCAKELLNAFFVEVKDGGVTYKTVNNGWWYEEYADEGRTKSMVLNGMMFTVLGIYEYYEYTQNSDAKYLFDQGIISLKENLYRYNKNGYSYYDILEHPAGAGYHNVYIQLLDSLYNITNEIVFQEYSNIWEKYKKTPLILRMIEKPTKAGIAIFVFNFFILFGLLEIIVSFKKRKHTN